MNPAALIGAAVALTAILARPVPAQTEAIPVDPAIPLAIRVDPPAFTEPVYGDCDSLHDIAIAAGWDESDWPTVEKIMWRESRCQWDVVNRVGCVGLLQVCRINHRRLGVTATDLKDPLVNLSVGRQLCEEWTARGRSCWRPWWLKWWRP